jgi:carbonic anhydrase
MCINCLAATRRSFIGGLAATATMTALASHSINPALAQAAKPNAIAPDAALKRLTEGNARYASNNMQEKDFSADRAQRAAAQYPIAAILSCADSRVAPELIFDQGPGELFIVRVAGNVANSDGIASLEYAIAVLNVPLIMVLGHSACGAVDSAIKVAAGQLKLPGHLPGLIAQITPAVKIAAKRSGNTLENAIEENARLGIRKISAATPVLFKAVQSKKIMVVGGVYDIASGKVRAIAV